MTEAEYHRPWWGSRHLLLAMILLGVAIVLIVLSTVLFPTSGTGYPYGSRMMGGGSFWLMGLVPLLFLFFFVFLLAAILLGRPHPPPGAYVRPPYAAASARELLDQRYANGDITREQYLRMKDDLTGSISSHG